MRWQAAHLAHADIHLRFAEPDRLELAVNVGDMDQRHVSESIEFKKLVLGELQAGRDLGPGADTGAPPDRRSGNGRLQEVSARDHGIPPGNL